VLSLHKVEAHSLKADEQ
jgi:hypothetical protein